MRRAEPYSDSRHKRRYRILAYMKKGDEGEKVGFMLNGIVLFIIIAFPQLGRHKIGKSF